MILGFVVPLSDVNLSLFVDSLFLQKKQQSDLGFCCAFSDVYSSNIWNLSGLDAQTFTTAWRKVVKRLWSQNYYTFQIFGNNKQNLIFFRKKVH